MLPHKHLAVSALVGVAGWLSTRKPSAIFYALVPGVLPDLDHAVDDVIAVAGSGSVRAAVLRRFAL